MAYNPDAFAREVDEELREDRLKTIWRRYGLYIAAAAVALVLGTAASVGWDAWQTSRRMADARAFDAAIVENGGAPMATAAALEAVAADASTGYRAIARLTAAQLHAAEGDMAAAQNSLATLAADAGAPELYRELALLLEIAAGFEAAAPDALIARLQPLTAAGEPWRHTARELTAAAQLRAGDTAAAVATLEDLVEDAETPQDLRARARELMAALGTDATAE